MIPKQIIEFIDELIQGGHVSELKRATISLYGESVKQKKIWEYLVLGGKAPDPVTSLKGSDREDFCKLLVRTYKDSTNTAVPAGHVDGFDPPESSYGKFIPVCDLVATDGALPKMWLIEKATMRISKQSYKSWIYTLTEDEKENLKEQPKHRGFFEFMPNTLKPTDKNEDGNIIVNTYVPPQWRLDMEGPMECPKVISDFLEHLFPCDKSREYVLDWLHHMIRDRNQCALVLNGMKGTGKGLFQEIAQVLVGSLNSRQAQTGFFSSNFNGVMLNSQLLYFDEIRIKKDDHVDKLKRYLNSELNLEVKHQEANRSYRNHNSFLITNNRETDIRVDEDDRRYSIVDMTTVILRKVMDQDSINDMLDQFHDPDVALAFGSFIYHRRPKHGPTSPFKGKHFDVMVEASRSEWQRVLVESLKEVQSPLLWQDVNNIFKREEVRLKPKRYTVTDWANSEKQPDGVTPWAEVLETRNGNRTWELKSLCYEGEYAIDDEDNELL